MKISEVNVNPVKPKDGLIAFASIVVDNDLYLGSIGVYRRLNGGFRITYPAKKVGVKDMSIFHPINKVTGSLIEQSIIEKCNEVFESSSDEGHSENGSENGQATLL